MMCLGETFAVMRWLYRWQERTKNGFNHLKKDNKEIILIPSQVNTFAGNMLEVRGKDIKGIWLWVLVAHQSLTGAKFSTLENMR
jgi:hypothetical protein